MQDKVKNQPVILPAQKVIKKKYIKPDFEVINLEDAPRLLAGSATNNNLNPNFGSDTQDIW